MSERVGLLVWAATGRVILRGPASDRGELEVQVVPDPLRSSDAGGIAASAARCDAFADDLEAVFTRHGIPLCAREVLT